MQKIKDYYKMIKLLNILTLVSLASKIVEYRLNYIYGQVFYDFSGNGRHGVNGATLAVEASDFLGTDRGAHSTGNSEKILLPANAQNVSAFLLPSSFSVTAWFYPSEVGGCIFFRYIDKNNYFVVQRQGTSSSIYGNITIAGVSTGNVYGAINSCKQCK